MDKDARDRGGLECWGGGGAEPDPDEVEEVVGGGGGKGLSWGRLMFEWGLA